MTTAWASDASTVCAARPMRSLPVSALWRCKSGGDVTTPERGVSVGQNGGVFSLWMWIEF